VFSQWLSSLKASCHTTVYITNLHCKHRHPLLTCSLPITFQSGNTQRHMDDLLHHTEKCLCSSCRYFMENLDVPFAIEETSGELFTTNFLDRETEAVYRLTVIGRDSHPTQPLSSSVLVIVLIGDVNDHWPQFLNGPYVAYVPTELPPGKTLLDHADGDTEMNADLHYSLYGQSSDLFSIDPSSGTVFTSKTLRETNDIIINVHVEDTGEAPKFDVTTISVSGSLSEDEPVGKLVAVISAESLRVPEDVPVGHTIMRVTSTDDDSDSNAVTNYSIVDESDDIRFNVDFTTGYITVVSPLDREERDYYILRVNANDSAWSISTDVTIVVSDVNDNRPVFSDPFYSVVLLENRQEEAFVLQVRATDADSGQNSEIFYFIDPSNEEFWVNSSSGEVYTKQELDYEAEHRHHLQIKAIDGGWFSKTGMLNVTVRVMDVNDNPPVFSSSEFVTSVPENSEIGTNVIDMKAVDIDSGVNALITYSLILSGDIYTTRSLRKQGNSHVVLKVLAKNAGVITGMNVDEALVQISVIDINDPPMFTSALYEANVTEDSPAGTPVIAVSAVDQDSILDWNRFFFSIDGGNTNSSFSVDPSSGVISVSSPLDRELWAVYNLTVTATDNGSPPATGTTNVMMVIGDINDNAPKLLFSESRVKENQPGGVTVAELDASDCDLPPNQGPFTYWLVHLSDAFSLTPDGVLLTSRTIDREQISLYRLLVVCEANPCRNEGTCVNTAGGFYCHCQEGFTGSVCSADVDEVPEGEVSKRRDVSSLRGGLSLSLRAWI
uniref:Uncharacterized protein n=1 Tax=Salarias fasciatus TaxID=181472 RepID=A0A672J6D1_SALFA